MKTVYAICTDDGQFRELITLSNDNIIEDNEIANENGTFDLTYKRMNVKINTQYIQKICVDEFTALY
jgi:formiminotetrahydrofolate cyclodeaminase